MKKIFGQYLKQIESQYSGDYEMKKQLTIAMGLALAGMGMSGVAAAEDKIMGLEFSANVALTSNYVFRGISESDEHASISGGFDAAHSSGLYAGVWGASVEGYSDASMELDYYIGWGGDVGPVGLDVGYLRYTYPGENPGTSDTDEFHIGVSGDVGPVSLGLTYNYSDDFYSAGDNDYWDLGAEMPIGSFTLAAHAGSTDRDDGTEYEDYSIGISTEAGGFGFDLTFTDTDGLANDEDYAIFTISKSL
ncbi:MAG: TorF family putative porin [Chromatiales bacterium]